MIRKIPWRLTTLIMFAVCIAVVWAVFSNGLMTMSGYVIINIATGAIALLGVTMLCLAYSMDIAPKDESSVMFTFCLLSPMSGFSAIIFLGLSTET